MLFSMLETYDHAHAGGPDTTMCNKINDYRNVTSPGGEDNPCAPNVVNDTVYVNSIVISVASVIGYMVAKSLVNIISKRALMGEYSYPSILNDSSTMHLYVFTCNANSHLLHRGRLLLRGPLLGRGLERHPRHILDICRAIEYRRHHRQQRRR